MVSEQPEIRPLYSFTLSLLSMFLGCYFNLLYLSLLLYSNQAVNSLRIHHQSIACRFLQWLPGTGVSPLPLILATLLVKMLHIF